jgi:hypothetical protein
MIPKSMVSSIIGFADQLQITHLKLQQSIAKAKPDGLIVDIEGLENVQLGRGGELQPLDIQDIYEQTGIFYYRSKNPDGSFILATGPDGNSVPGTMMFPRDEVEELNKEINSVLDEVVEVNNIAIKLSEFPDNLEMSAESIKGLDKVVKDE